MSEACFGVTYSDFLQWRKQKQRYEINWEDIEEHQQYKKIKNSIHRTKKIVKKKKKHNRRKLSWHKGTTKPEDKRSQNRYKWLYDMFPRRYLFQQ